MDIFLIIVRRNIVSQMLYCLLTLPKDVLWMINKKHLSDYFPSRHVEIRIRELHGLEFYAFPVISQRSWFERTPNGSEQLNILPCFVDFLYPLRLVCKKFDSLLREKITRNGFGRLKVSV